MLLVSACSGLAGEPEIVATVVQSTPTPELNDIGYPQALPDLALGSEVYAANCTRCHGINGAGDGELVLAGQVMNPGNFTDPAQIDGQDPNDYFGIITYGNLEALMPPWGEALTEEERWAVAHYTYTLHYDGTQTRAGAEIYVAECARCHGDSGRGDGPEANDAGRDIGNLADPQTMIYLSDDNIYTIITEGAGTAMPAYAETLNEDQLRAVVAYTRSLSVDTVEVFDRDQSPIAEATAEVTQEAASNITGTISGDVLNGTAGGSVPADLIVTLHIIDRELQEQTITTSLDENRRFVFEDVPVSDSNAYFVSARYNNRSFATAPFLFTAQTPLLDTLLTIYEITDDASVIGIETMVTHIRPTGDVLEITQDVTFVNSSDRMFITNRDMGDERFASVEVPLPIGAAPVVLQPENRYLFDEETFVLTDTRPLIPGQAHQVQLVYVVPYQNGAIIEYPVNYAFNGQMILLVDSETVTASSEQLILIDPTAVPNVEARAYGGNLNLAPGDLIRYELRGAAPGVGTSDDPSVVTSDNLLPVVLVGIGVMGAIVAGVFFFGLRAKKPEGEIDALVRQIARLDALHEAGQINHDLYQRQRAELKAQLAELMGETHE